MSFMIRTGGLLQRRPRQLNATAAVMCNACFYIYGVHVDHDAQEAASRGGQYNLMQQHAGQDEHVHGIL